MYDANRQTTCVTTCINVHVQSTCTLLLKSIGTGREKFNDTLPYDRAGPGNLPYGRDFLPFGSPVDAMLLPGTRD